MGDDLTDWTGKSWYPLHVNWCHEHCSVCMATACGCVDHGSEWQDGYWSIESEEGYDGTWDLYLCPECFAKLSEVETVQVLSNKSEISVHPARVIRPLRPEEVPEVAAFYIDIQADTVPTIHPLNEVIDYIANVRVAHGSSYVLEQNDKILGWLDVADGWVHHLCVRRGETGKGIGHELLTSAKFNSPKGLQLWTFQVNDGARRFYAREGFQEVELTNGENCEEKQPDVRLEWKPNNL